MKVVPTGNRYALLIGVNQYAKPIQSLRFCANDMKTLAASFQKIGVPEENIFLMTDDSEPERRPTRANIERQIESIAQLMGEEDQLTIAFSGHGVMVDGKSYLCPSDTDLENRDSIVSRDWAFEQLEKCAARQKIFIVDACRDEVAFGGTKALGGAKTLEDPIGAETHGFVLIASCDKKQQSWEDETLEHGVFTHFLAEGLAGAAGDEDGYVSILDLFQYASRKTKKYVFREFNRVQVPTFRQGSEMTDFCVAKLETASTPVPPVSGPDVTEVAAPATVMSHSDINELKKQLDGKFEYEVTDSSVTITKYIGSAPNVEIPHGVTSIGDYAFEYCESLTSVTIPDSVTSIGWGVFSSCYDLTIYGKSGSEAERYAEKEGIKFQVR